MVSHRRMIGFILYLSGSAEHQQFLPPGIQRVDKASNLVKHAGKPLATELPPQRLKESSKKSLLTREPGLQIIDEVSGCQEQGSRFITDLWKHGKVRQTC